MMSIDDPFKDVRDLMSDIRRKTLEAENKVFNDVIHQVLGREATEDDYKDFSITLSDCYEPIFKYALSYKGIPVGVMKRELAMLDMGARYTVSFTPYNNNEPK